MYRLAQFGIVFGFLLCLSALILREVGLGRMAVVYGVLLMMAGAFGVWGIRYLRR